MDRLHGLCIAVVLVAAPTVAQGEAPRVHFDMPDALACRDVTPEGFAKLHPGQKLVEAKFEISTLLVAGAPRDLTECFVRIDSLQRTLLVADYLPKTLHESPLAGPVSVQNTDETSGSIGINLAGKYEVLTTAGATAGVGQKNVSCVKYELLPPRQTVAASGTLLRGRAAFFKLLVSPRHPLEGSRELALVFRVPADWRADYVRVRCQAEGVERGLVSSLDSRISAGQREFLVALYQAGDEEARRAAEAFSQSESLLRMTALRRAGGERTATSSAATIPSLLPRSLSSLPTRLSLPIGGKTTPVADPERWLPEVLYGNGEPPALPQVEGELQLAVGDFIAARQRLAELSGPASR
jgi:hypothetical protein